MGIAGILLAASLGLSGPKPATCTATKWIGWKAKSDITDFDKENYELAKLSCAKRNNSRNPCLKEFHKWTVDSKFLSEYYGFCGRPKS